MVVLNAERSRMPVTLTVAPGWVLAMWARMSCELFTLAPSNAVMTSPGCRPASSAGLFRYRSTTSTLPRGSVLVVDLYLNSPALEAGLQPGDVITAFDGASVKSSQDILAHIASTQPGATVKVTGMRDRSAFKTTITVRQRPRDL